jgi:uncharacterized protein YndB with AHSA1/START domain
MALQLFKKTKQLDFERTYPAPIETVWRAWTDADLLRRWWSPKDTSVTDCEVDPRVGGTIHVVMEAGEGMGKYQGTRWPMDGVFTQVDEHDQLAYDAQSWTEGERESTTIDHTNTATFSTDGTTTTVHLRVAITAIGPKAKMAAFGMKWGYKAYLAKLDEILTGG